MLAMLSKERPWAPELPSLVGQPFPFSDDPFKDNTWWRPVLLDGRLRRKPLVIFLSWPFVVPYAGTQPPPSTEAAARALAERLRDTGWTVMHVMVAPQGTVPEPPADPRLPNLVYRLEPGDVNGEPLISDRGDSWRLRTQPTTFVVGRDEIVRGLFEGRDAWDVDAIERAVRRALP